MVAQLSRTSDEPSQLAPASLHAGKYLVEGVLSRVGSHLFLLGRQPSLDRDIIIERMPMSDATQLSTLTTACETLKKLGHIDIAQCLELFAEDGALHIVMAAGKGKPLSALNAISQRDAVMVGVHICNALNYLHRIPQFDHLSDLLIDPSDIFVTDGHRARLMGLAGILGVKDNVPSHFAPRAGEQSAVFCLGASLHHALTGWSGWYSDGAPPIATRRADIAPEFDRVIMRAITLDPNERWQSIEAFRYALLRFE